jgi:hypothetical protein
MTDMTSHQAAQPMISFIVPYYNLPKALLCECIDSILALPLDDNEREIVVVDDGSSFCPLNEMEDYRDRLIYVRQNNAGLSEARNRGIDISTGRYIQFVDGDDCLIGSGYEHCLSVVRKDDTVDLLMFHPTTEQEVVQNIADNEPQSGSAYMKHENLRASAWGYLFKRSILGKLRFTPGLLHEDEDFTPQLMLRAEKVVETTAVAYYYRQRDNSIMTNLDPAHVEKRLNDKESIIGKLHVMADRLPMADRLGMQRRVHQLTMDYLYDTIVTTRSEEELERRIRQLEQKGLFPLPDKDYTQKYKWFRLLSKNKLTRKLLMKAVLKAENR